MATHRSTSKKEKDKEGKRRRENQKGNNGCYGQHLNRIAKRSCKPPSALGQSSVKLPMPEGWANSDFPSP